MKHYLCSQDGERVLRLRVGMSASIQSLPYGQVVNLNGVNISLHPAGHILGSAQVRVEKDGEVVVVSGDYKTEPDRTCQAFESIKCHTFITESTFGLPIYNWQPEKEVFCDVNEWCRSNQAKGTTTILVGYSLGKSQRVLSAIDPSLGVIYLHKALRPYTEAYQEQGVIFPAFEYLSARTKPSDLVGAIVLAPSPHLEIGGKVEGLHFASAFLSGWMAVDRFRKTRGRGHGFVVSDHVDWKAMLSAISATRAEKVMVTHGYRGPVVRYLREKGLDASVLPEPNSIHREYGAQLEPL